MLLEINYKIVVHRNFKLINVLKKIVRIKALEWLGLLNFQEASVFKYFSCLYEPWYIWLDSLHPS